MLCSKKSMSKTQFYVKYKNLYQDGATKGQVTSDAEHDCQN